MRKLMFLAVVFVVGCSSSGLSAGPGSGPQKPTGHDCATDMAAGVSYKYCVDRAPGNNDDSEVFYYFHGINGSEQSWQQISQLYGFSQLRGGKGLPTVISISFGPAWLLAQVNHAGQPNLYDLTMKTIVPHLESQLRDKVLRRTLIGQSMGGFNSLQILVRNPELFERVALICPALSELSPFVTEAEITTYLGAHPEVQPRLLAMVRALGLKTFANEQEYAPHNPVLLQSGLSPVTPPLFISAGDHDEFGFFTETDAFAAAASLHGAQVTYRHIVGGGHCQLDSGALTALAGFLN